MFVRIAQDLGVDSRETVRDWLKRNGSVPLVHWPRLIDVLEQKFGMVVTYRQLVEATIRVRLSRKSEAA